MTNLDGRHQSCDYSPWSHSLTKAIKWTSWLLAEFGNFSAPKANQMKMKCTKKY